MSDAHTIADKVRAYRPEQNYLALMQQARGPAANYALISDTMRPKEVRYFVLQQRKK